MPDDSFVLPTTVTHLAADVRFNGTDALSAIVRAAGNVEVVVGDAATVAQDDRRTATPNKAA